MGTSSVLLGGTARGPGETLIGSGPRGRAHLRSWSNPSGSRRLPRVGRGLLPAHDRRKPSLRVRLPTQAPPLPAACHKKPGCSGPGGTPGTAPSVWAGGGRALGEQQLGLVGPHAVLVPYPAEEIGELLVTRFFGVPDVSVVGRATLQGVEEHGGEVADGVRLPWPSRPCLRS